jgi:tetratricopeptide (TPR) repeat protein
MKRSIHLSSLVIAAVLIAGCATPRSAPRVDAAISTAPAQAPTETAYPGVTLTPDILYALLLGEIAGQRGDLGTAVQALGRTATTTRDPRLAERATQAALYAKNHEAALKTATLWMELQPHNLEAREALAESLFALGRTDEALREFERILADAAPRKQLGQAYLRIGAVLGRAQNRQLGLDLMHTLVDLHQDSPEAYFALAHLAVRQDDLEKADKAIDRVLALRPDSEEAATFKVRVLMSRKESAQAQAYFEQFLSAHPKASAFRLSFARYLVELKQWEKALLQFKRVTKERPQDAEAMYAAGLLALQTNQLGEAETFLERNLALQPDNDQARLYLGQVAEERKRYGDATRWYSEITADEYRFEAQARMATVLAKQGAVDDALVQLRQIQPASNQQRVQVALAEDQILREARRRPEALDVLSVALSELPDDPDLLYARALAAEKLDMLDMHERDLRRLLKKDPANAHALNALGYTLADRTNRHREALVLIEQALALRPDDPFIMDSMGWVQYRLGNLPEAIKYLRRAMTLRNDAEIAAHLGEVLWVNGDRADAESIWRRALEGTPDNEVLLAIIKKFKH